MRVTIHQPEHLPWLGFFAKVAAVDELVILDTVQYKKNHYMNRNKLRTAQGWQWLTIPVAAHPLQTPIDRVQCGEQANMAAEKNLRAVEQHYHAAPWYAQYGGGFAKIYRQAAGPLAEYNARLLLWLITQLGIQVRIRRAADLAVAGLRETELLLAICRETGATEYLSGHSGRDYLDERQFASAGIAVSYQEYVHPEYRQQYAPFMPGMSVLDLLFNHGPEALNIIRSGDRA